jgi:hypothetical protein
MESRETVSGSSRMGGAARPRQDVPDAVIQHYQDALASGQPVAEPTFWSSSVDPAVTQQKPFAGNIDYVIESVHGKEISQVAVYPEAEVLFAPGTNFEVLAVDEPVAGHYEVLMQEVP